MIVKHISAVLFGALFLNTACATDTTKVHFKNLEPEIMRGVTKKVLKLNTASRKLSRLSTAIRKIKK